MNRAQKRELARGRGRHDGRRRRYWIMRPTGELDIEIRLPPPVFDAAQRILDAVRTQSRHESEAGEELRRLLRPYYPHNFNPRRDHLTLTRERAAQVLTPAGAS